MNKKTIGIGIAALVIIIVIVIGVGYNSFVKLDENVKNKWSEVQSNYQRRQDLVPSLVGIVKGGTDYERKTLVDVTEARAKAGQVNVAEPTFEGYQQKEKVEGNLTTNLNKVIAVVEKYPDLQSNNQFKTLQVQLEGTERRIKFARKDFNEAVMGYNNKARSFPWNIVGGLLGFKPKAGFSADGGAQNAPEVIFSDSTK